MFCRRLCPVAVLLGVLLAVSEASAQLAAQPVAGQWRTTSTPQLEGLGTHRYAVTTRSPAAQRLFDQGLRLGWAGEQAQAASSFLAAEELDTTCTMCAWGVAWVLGRDRSDARSARDHPAARSALDRALLKRRRVSPREAAIIVATAQRFRTDLSPAGLDSAYASALQTVSVEFPDDDEVRALYAEALLLRRDRPAWLSGVALGTNGQSAESALARVLSRSPSHPGACGLLMELAPAAALPLLTRCAERLSVEMPAASQLQHLASVVFTRLGRYDEAIRTGEVALRASRVPLAPDVASGWHAQRLATRRVRYWQSLSFAATMCGRYAYALDAARQAAALAAGAGDARWQESGVASVVTTHASFGAWQQVLQVPLPPTSQPLARGLTWYARGVAFAALSRWHEAGLALGAVRDLREQPRDAHSRTALRIAAHALAGEIELRRGRPGFAVLELQRAAALEDALPDDTPPIWHFPVRHALGKALLAANRAPEAVRVYEQDLQRYRENGWSLLGLAQSLDAAGRRFEGRLARERFVMAFSSTDVTLPASRF